MENKDWKDLLGEAFNIDANVVQQQEQTVEKELTALEQQGKKMIDIILDKKGRNGKKATIIANLSMDDETIKKLASDMKRACSVGGSARGGEILIQGDMRERVLKYLTSQGFKARVI
jgi:translation initiation factor 1